MHIFNTMTRQKEAFIPLKEGEVTMYACGPTVYNYFHIGNARPFIVFDALRRYLEYQGNHVVFVQNFTDIDDKMIRKAKEEGKTVQEIADFYIQEYYKDADQLGIERASANPKATEHIDEIIALIETLIQKGHAYVTETGDVYYEPKTFPSYGCLSGQNLDDLEAGARIEVNDDKKNPSDFALWKAQKPGEPAWDCPWGKGRPGWHIECSAMSMKYLGPTFDIHCGGADLIFPHHENEIAQSEGASGETFARYWMHNGYINVDNQKMSKSAGNFFTVRDIGEKYDLQAVRLFILSAHYRSPINFSDSLLDQAVSALERIRNAEVMLDHAAQRADDKEADPTFLNELDRYREQFVAALDDDLNTADAIAAIFDLVRMCNIRFAQQGTKGEAETAAALLEELLTVLGLERHEKEAIPEEVVALAEQRQKARVAKDWAESDRIRDELAQKGYVIEDGKEGYQIKQN